MSRALAAFAATTQPRKDRTTVNVWTTTIPLLDGLMAHWIATTGCTVTRSDVINRLVIAAHEEAVEQGHIKSTTV